VPVVALAHSISTGPKTCYNKRTQAKEMSTPNWQHNSGKQKNTKGFCKGKLKSRKQALQALKSKLNFK
jgi:hypothetical protein